MGIYLTRAGWSLDDIGYWEALLFGAAVLGGFWMEGWIKVFLASHSEKTIQGVYRWVLLRVVAFAVVAGLLWLAFFPVIKNVLIPGVPMDWLHPFLLFFVIWMPTIILANYYLAKGRSGPIWLLGVYYLVGFPLAIAIPDFMGFSPAQCIWGLLVWVTPLVFGLLRSYLYAPAPVELVTTKLLWKRWRALSLYALLAMAAPLLDAWFVQWMYADPGVFAIFRYGARELPLASTLAVAISTAMIPVLSVRMDSGLAELKQRIRRLTWMLFPIAAVLLIAARPLYTFVFTDAFEDSAGIFQVYVLLIVSQLVIVQPVLIATGNERWLIRAAVLELGLNASLSLLLGLQFGIMGIVWATFIAFVFEKVYLLVKIRSQLQIEAKSFIPVQHLYYSIGLLVLYGGIVYFS